MEEIFSLMPIDIIIPTKPKEPIKPIDYDANSEGGFLSLSFINTILIACPIIMIIAGVVSKDIDNNKMLIALGSIILFIGLIINYTLSNSKKEKSKRFFERMKEYESALELYKTNIEKYNLAIEKYNSPSTIEHINKYREKEIDRYFLIRTRIPTINRRNSLSHSGVTNDYFGKHLYYYFPNIIFINPSIEATSSLTIDLYRCDFLYYDKEKSLMIDIEIDEPYVENTPINYMNFGNQKRDSQLSYNGVIVMRFSEKQIIETPEGCCRQIEKIIKKVIPNYVELIEDYNIERTTFWTKSEASKLIDENYRKSYLNVDMVNKLGTERYGCLTDINRTSISYKMDDLPF